MTAFAVRHSLDRVSVQPLSLDWSLALERPETKLARDYWLSRHRDGVTPSRKDISPTDFRGFVANVGLIEFDVSPPERVRYLIRLAGSKWEEVFGRMKGRSLDEFLPSTIEERWRTVFDAVRETGKPLRVTTRIAFKSKTWLSTEMFVAPLSEDGANVSMLLMCFTSWRANS